MNVEKYIIPKEIILDLYLDKKKPLSEIAEIFNCSSYVITDRCKKFGIPLRNRWEMTKINRRYEKEYQINKEDLERYYFNDKLSLTKISDIYGCSFSTIKKRFIEYGISHKKKPRFNISKEELKELYCNKKMTLKEIAKLYGVRDCTIRNRCISYNIYPKDHEAVLKRRGYLKNCDITPYLKQLLDGVMISDGFYTNTYCDKTSKLIVAQCKRNSGWLCEIQQILKKHGIDSKIYERTTPCNGKNFAVCSLETSEYVEFRQQRDRWYKDGRKELPDDLEIDLVFLSHWLMGDGCCSKKSGKRKRNYYSLFFCTESFTKKEVESLTKKLNDTYGWEFKIKRYDNKTILNGKEYQVDGYRIEIAKSKQIYDFLYRTYPYHAECFKYKWAALDKLDFTDHRKIKKSICKIPPVSHVKHIVTQANTICMVC